ncbi:hypothetical protein [Chitinophaga sp. LS1]|uniref:hypothetical protein n=1 Tax=Chitinophaga sp. LS1 TaxID=3051176 RepID=UPI002AAB5748|nr:hypothetical protein [Chitinophaga sp. LS1]WPV67719.1 hypothetical protein QQL36_03135 [Chitinophaga sp. LS1]
MQTSNVFHAPRFGAYFKKHIVDNLRLYLMSLVVLVGVLVAIGVISILTNNRETVRVSFIYPFYAILLFGAGLIFTGFSFIQLGDKPKGIDYLLLPASHFEKFLTTLLITTAGFLLVYHIAFGTATFIGAGLVSLSRDTHVMDPSMPDDFRNDMTQLYHWWFMGQAIILLGSVYFPKYSIIKTLFAVFIFILVIGLVNAAFMNILFYGHLMHWAASAPFFGVGITEHPHMEEYRSIFLESPHWMRETLYFMWRFILPPVLWVLAYFRLKDKEI